MIWWVIMSNSYGMELVLDLRGCDPETFNRESITRYFEDLCVLIDMVPCARYFWDDVGEQVEEKQTAAHTKGTSAVQFILTSNITIHTLDLLGKVFVNVFSCKDFDRAKARDFTAEHFGAKGVDELLIIRN